MLEDAVEKRHWINKFDPEGKSIATIQLPRILGQLIKRECKKGVILELDASAIAGQWNNAVEGLERALEVLYERYGAITSDWIPSTDIITPLAVILVDPRFGARHYPHLDKWYWRSVFGQYFRGAPETKISRSVREIQAPSGWLSDGGDEPDAVTNFQFTSSSIDEATKNTTVYKGLMTLMISKSPYDIGLERRRLRDLAETDVHDHHIFPQKFLKDNGIKGVEANQILNRMPIWRTTNERISSYAPNVYLIDRNKCHSDVSQHLAEFYALDPSFLEDEFTSFQYGLFLIDRKDKFISLIEAATGASRSVSLIAEDA